MANVAVRGQPVEDPWLTWSTPEYGEGFWPINDHEVDTMALARQSIPCPDTQALRGCASDLDGIDPGARALIESETGGVLDPNVQALIDIETGGGLDPATVALIAHETRRPASLASAPTPTPGPTHSRPPMTSTRPAAPGMDKPTFYGAASTWQGEGASFTSTLVGWGLLVRDPVHDRVLPTVRTGRLLFGTGVIAGLVWGFSGRSW